ncbi:MAG: hypothetical protein JWO60_935 [Frankiales bacterium]|nr:hypothetical protein [Frankiales bacterium]
MTRTAHRARAGLTVAGAALLGLVLSAAPALADHNPLAPQEGADEHTSMTIQTALLLFGLVPLLLLLVIGGIVWLPGAVRSGRYRPQRGWSAAPVWFAGPADPVAAVEVAAVRDEARGGARGDW